MSNPEFLVEGILPSNEVHLLAGSSGAGKTTFLFQMLAEWQEGKPILGHTSHPVPYAYISADRSQASVERTLERLGLLGKITRMVCREHLPAGMNLLMAISKSRELFPDAKAFFIEGFQTMVGDKGNNYTAVATMLASTTALCVAQGITIIGVCHSPKIKTDEKFQHSREVVLGSVAWAAYSDTIITLELDESCGLVTIKIMPRNAAREEYKYRFGERGKLVEVEALQGRADLELHLYALPVGAMLTKQAVLELAGQAGVRSRTAEAVLAEYVATGILGVIGRGTYQRTADRRGPN